MKKNTLSLILVLWFNFGFGQVQYSNYLDNTSEWRYFSGGWDGVNGHSTYTTTYFDGVEIINGLVYYKEYSNSIHYTNWWYGATTSETTLSGPSYVREDSTGKFYRINSTTNLEEVYFDNQEIIDAQVGDPFPYPGATCEVQSTETIYLGSVPLKKINGTVSGSTTGTLEGIGVIGLACVIVIEGTGNLSCYTKQGIDIQFGTINCNSFPIPNRVNLSTDSNNISENELIIYPNPTNGIFTIISDSQYETKTYSILNFNGSIVMKGNFKINNQEIDISDLTDGIYFLKTVGENSTEYRKIIKK